MLHGTCLSDALKSHGCNGDGDPDASTDDDGNSIVDRPTRLVNWNGPFAIDAVAGGFSAPAYSGDNGNDTDDSDDDSRSVDGPKVLNHVTLAMKRGE